MVWRSRFLPRLLFLAGALLLAKGSFSVFPFLFPAIETEVPVATIEAASPRTRFEAGTPLFTMSIPRHNAHFTVVEGTTSSALRTGPGHLEGSPIPGTIGNAVIAGHRDTHFRVLKDVSIGDEIRVDVGKKEITYRVVDIRIVTPDDTRVIQPQRGQVLTLITCYPFYFVGPAPERYVVKARAVVER